MQREINEELSHLFDYKDFQASLAKQNKNFSYDNQTLLCKHEKSLLPFPNELKSQIINFLNDENQLLGWVLGGAGAGKTTGITNFVKKIYNHKIEEFNNFTNESSQWLPVYINLAKQSKKQGWDGDNWALEFLHKYEEWLGLNKAPQVAIRAAQKPKRLFILDHYDYLPSPSRRISKALLTSQRTTFAFKVLVISRERIANATENEWSFTLFPYSKKTVTNYLLEKKITPDALKKAIGKDAHSILGNPTILGAFLWGYHLYEGNTEALYDHITQAWFLREANRLAYLIEDLNANRSGLTLYLRAYTQNFCNWLASHQKTPRCNEEDREKIFIQFEGNQSCLHLQKLDGLGLFTATELKEVQSQLLHHLPLLRSGMLFSGVNPKNLVHPLFFDFFIARKRFLSLSELNSIECPIKNFSIADFFTTKPRALNTKQNAKVICFLADRAQKDENFRLQLWSLVYANQEETSKSEVASLALTILYFSGASFIAKNLQNISLHQAYAPNIIALESDFSTSPFEQDGITACFPNGKFDNAILSNEQAKNISSVFFISNNLKFSGINVCASDTSGLIWYFSNMKELLITTLESKEKPIKIKLSDLTEKPINAIHCLSDKTQINQECEPLLLLLGDELWLWDMKKKGLKPQLIKTDIQDCVLFNRNQVFIQVKNQHPEILSYNPKTGLLKESKNQPKKSTYCLSLGELFYLHSEEEGFSIKRLGSTIPKTYFLALSPNKKNALSYRQKTQKLSYFAIKSDQRLKILKKWSLPKKHKEYPVTAAVFITSNAIALGNKEGWVFLYHLKPTPHMVRYIATCSSQIMSLNIYGEYLAIRSQTNVQRYKLHPYDGELSPKTEHFHEDGIISIHALKNQKKQPLVNDQIIATDNSGKTICWSFEEGLYLTSFQISGTHRGIGRLTNGIPFYYGLTEGNVLHIYHLINNSKKNDFFHLQWPIGYEKSSIFFILLDPEFLALFSEKEVVITLLLNENGNEKKCTVFPFSRNISDTESGKYIEIKCKSRTIFLDEHKHNINGKNTFLSLTACKPRTGKPEENLEENHTYVILNFNKQGADDLISLTAQEENDEEPLELEWIHSNKHFFDPSTLPDVSASTAYSQFTAMGFTSGSVALYYREHPIWMSPSLYGTLSLPEKKSNTGWSQLLLEAQAQAEKFNETDREFPPILPIEEEQNISQDTWALYWIRRKGSEHTYLMVDGVNSAGQRHTAKAELIKSESGGETKICLYDLELGDLNYFYHQGVSEQYYYKTWRISKEEGKILLENIIQDQKKTFYYRRLASLTRSLFNSQEDHNCVTWAQEKLQQIPRIQLDKKNEILPSKILKKFQEKGKIRCGFLGEKYLNEEMPGALHIVRGKSNHAFLVLEFILNEPPKYHRKKVDCYVKSELNKGSSGYQSTGDAFIEIKAFEFQKNQKLYGLASQHLTKPQLLKAQSLIEGYLTGSLRYHLFGNSPLYHSWYDQNYHNCISFCLAVFEEVAGVRDETLHRGLQFFVKNPKTLIKKEILSLDENQKKHDNSERQGGGGSKKKLGSNHMSISQKEYKQSSSTSSPLVNCAGFEVLLDLYSQKGTVARVHAVQHNNHAMLLIEQLVKSHNNAFKYVVRSVHLTTPDLKRINITHKNSFTSNEEPLTLKNSDGNLHQYSAFPIQNTDLNELQLEKLAATIHDCTKITLKKEYYKLVGSVKNTDNHANCLSYVLNILHDAFLDQTTEEKLRLFYWPEGEFTQNLQGVNLMQDSIESDGATRDDPNSLWNYVGQNAKITGYRTTLVRKLSEESNQAPQINHIKNLVLSGGGTKCTAFIGCLDAMKNAGILDTLESVAGTSGGAILAFCVAVGMSVEEMIQAVTEEVTLAKMLEDSEKTLEKLMKAAKKAKELYEKFEKAMKPEKVTDDGDQIEQQNQNKKNPSFFNPSLKGSQITSLGIESSHLASRTMSQLKNSLIGALKTMGIFDGKRFIDYFEKTLKKHGLPKHCTFQDLATEVERGNRKFRKLRVMLVNLTDGSSKECSVEKTPNVTIASAVLASMSLPFVFKPAHLDERFDNELIPSEALYTDGGLLNNYPIELFQDCWDDTIGLRLVSAQGDEQTANELENPKNILEFLFKMNHALIHREGNDYRQNPKARERTIEIPTAVDTLHEFKLDEILPLLRESKKVTTDALGRFCQQQEIRLEIPTPKKNLNNRNHNDSHEKIVFDELTHFFSGMDSEEALNKLNKFKIELEKKIGQDIIQNVTSEKDLMISLRGLIDKGNFYGILEILQQHPALILKKHMGDHLIHLIFDQKKEPSKSEYHQKYAASLPQIVEILKIAVDEFEKLEPDNLIRKEGKTFFAPEKGVKYTLKTLENLLRRYEKGFDYNDSVDPDSLREKLNIPLYSSTS